MNLFTVLLIFFVTFNSFQIFSRGDESCAKYREEIAELRWNISELLDELESAKGALDICKNPFGEITADVYNNQDLMIKDFAENDAFLTEYRECNTLYETLESSGKLQSSEAIPLAIKIKASMEKALKSPKTFAKLNNLKSKLPRALQIIVWNRKTMLINKSYPSEYMYAVADEVAPDNERRKIFMWKPGGEHSQGDWKFSTQNNGESFLIKNMHFNEFLYAAYDGLAYDNERRNIYTWRPGSSDGCDWKVEIVGDDEIRLKDNKYHEYLYAATFGLDDQKRYVFTWRPLSGCDDSCIWKIKASKN